MYQNYDLRRAYGTGRREGHRHVLSIRVRVARPVLHTYNSPLDAEAKTCTALQASAPTKQAHPAFIARIWNVYNNTN